MYDWYAAAEHCYVFLSDVPSIDDKHGQAALLRSQWFTRGWTLQELLAPANVTFFSGSGIHLGTRETLSEIICKVTGIDEQALLGKPLHEFSVDVRFTWAIDRHTFEPEDKAYCLLGIFGVSMLPHYGEGKHAAFDRLKEEIIRKYRNNVIRIEVDEDESSISSPSSNTVPTVNRRGLLNPGLSKDSAKQKLTALLNRSIQVAADDHSGDLARRRATIQDLLHFERFERHRDEIAPAHSATCQWLTAHWILLEWMAPHQQDHSLLWIKGHPGTGKTTLMKYLDFKLSEGHTNCIVLSFYFNSRGTQVEKSVEGMYRTLILQLLRARPDLRIVLHHLKFGRQQLPEPDIFAEPSIPILQETFSALVARLEGQKIYCLIDALDEANEEDVLDTVYFLKTFRTGARLLFCFSSRHYPVLDLPTHLQIVVEDEPGHNDDILNYLLTTLRLPEGSYLDRNISRAVATADGVFLWIVLIVSVLNREHRRGEGAALVDKHHLDHMPEKLKDLFKDILLDADKHAPLSDGLIVLLYAVRPLSLLEYFFATTDFASSLDMLKNGLEWDEMERHLLASSRGLAELNFSAEEMNTRTKAKAYSSPDIVNLPPDGTPRVQFIHESVKEFLLGDSGSAVLYKNKSSNLPLKAHSILRDACADALSVASRTAVGRIASFPLLNYAVEYLLLHTDRVCDYSSGSSTSTHDTFLKHFQYENWRRRTWSHEQLKSLKSVSLLGTAVELGYTHLTKDLLRLEPRRLEDRNPIGETVMMISVRTGASTETIELLINHGADVHAVDRDGHGIFYSLSNARVTSIFEHAMKRTIYRQQDVDDTDAATRSTTKYHVGDRDSLVASVSRLMKMRRDSERTSSSSDLHSTDSKPVKQGLWKRIVNSAHR